MNQAGKAQQFASLHVSGNPLVLFNIWDAGSAQAVEKAGAKAIATGSWSVATAHGYDDGEVIPLGLVEKIARQICSTVPLPVTIDFEGAYAETPDEAAANAQRILDAGAVGINFEDRIVNGNGIYAVSTQCDRIGAIREIANQRGIPLFINARTDLFLQAPSGASHAQLVDEARARAVRYGEAGANGFFVPGLAEAVLIADLCQHTPMPINTMMSDSGPSVAELAELGVSRVSFGPSPYAALMGVLSQQARQVFA